MAAKQEVEIIDSIQERIDRDGLGSLTQPERFYRAIYFLESDTSNGAFEHFFRSWPGSLVRDALLGLRAVGAKQMAGYLESAIQTFQGVLPEDDAVRGAILDSLTDFQQAEVDRLSDLFSDYPDDLKRLVKAYVDAHESEFKGPRTLLELWQSKHQRGVNTTPRYVTRKIDFGLEAERDKPYSTRPCPACNYPSPDYRKTCKKCGFPHGRVKP